MSTQEVSLDHMIFKNKMSEGGKQSGCFKKLWKFSGKHPQCSLSNVVHCWGFLVSFAKLLQQLS